jgi:hypothetical protein
MPAAANAFSERCHAMRAAGIPILDLTISNPTAVGLFNDDSWLRCLSKADGARYRPEPFGLATARSAIADLYTAKGFPVDAAQVVLCSSTSEAYSWLFALLCDSGDSILIPTPSYPLLDHLASFAQVRPRLYGIGYDGAYYIDMNSVRTNLDSTTRTVVLVSPNNPTGSYTRREELEQLELLSLPLISDEVFADFCLSPTGPDLESVLEAKASLVFALGGLSKSFAWPQLKLAWIIVGGPKRLREEALVRLELIADTYLSANTLVQEALPELLAFGATRQAQVKRRLLANLSTIEPLARGSAMSARPAPGGWTAVLSLPLTEPLDWATTLLEQERVLVQPGWFYDFADERLIVVSLLTPEAEFAEGISRIVNRAN